MRTYLDCVPCFIRQALEAARLATDDEATQEKIIRRSLRLAAEQDYAQPPPVMGQALHRLIRQLAGDGDPYREAKEHFNQVALRLYHELKERIRQSERPFETAARLAIAGNIIDLGVHGGLKTADVEEAVGEALHAPLDKEAVARLEERVRSAREILYVADNAGEIVLDRLLVEELPPDRTTAVVRGAPVLNDATLEDARATGLTEVVRVIGNGSDAPGTLLEDCSEEVRQLLASADLVIAKGQGNYETLSQLDDRAFFLLRAKCPVIADHIGCPVGALVISQGKGQGTPSSPASGE